MQNDPPEKIYHVSMSQFSIARYYGGCTFNGKEYVYNPEEDSLTRIDVLKKSRSRTKAKSKQKEIVYDTE